LKTNAGMSEDQNTADLGYFSGYRVFNFDNFTQILLCEAKSSNWSATRSFNWNKRTEILYNLLESNFTLQKISEI
jgi:hypothetical protein